MIMFILFLSAKKLEVTGSRSLPLVACLELNY